MKSKFDTEAIVQDERAEEVRGAIRHLWEGYRLAGIGHDEIGPISGDPRKNVWGGVGMFVLDTLDTLWLAGLQKEFAEGEEWISSFNLNLVEDSNYDLGERKSTSFFEMTIRGLAGLLSAYALSGHQVLLEKAKLLGDRLLQGFPNNSSHHLWPVKFIDIHNPSNVQVTSDMYHETSLLADVGSNVLEFNYLSEATGDSRYQRAADDNFNKLIELSSSKDQALAPTELDPYALKFYDNTVSVSGMADSYFEYLLKRYIQTGCKQQHLLSTWKKAMTEMRQALLAKTNTGLVYIQSAAERYAPGQYGPSYRGTVGMEHLSCYVPGMLALASHYVPAEEVEDWWWPTAVELTRTCYEMYRISPHGLAPETVLFDSEHMVAGAKDYRLRPETLESLFYLYRISENKTYQDWSWNIFKAINNVTKAQYGFATVADVMADTPEQEDSEETFMGAETLKYALLTQMPSSALPLDKFVFNTEAHPFPAARA